MHDHAAYGLKIRSELLLPELLAASALHSAPTPQALAAPHVHIRLTPFDHSPPPRFASDALVWATPDAAFLDYPGTAAFLVRGGNEILIDIHAGAEPELIRLFLLGPAFALLLHQRGFLVLHASAVMIGSHAAAFVGDKGMGKSTMAAALHATGWPLVSDDLVAIDTAVDPPLAYPGFPQLKLFPESAALLEPDPRQLPRVHPQLDKRARRAIEGFSTRSLPLRRVFTLHDADAETVEQLAPRPAFMELVRHSYLLGFLQATGSAAAHFQQAIALASRTPVMRLSRRRSFAVLPSVVRLVEDDLARAA